MEWEVGEERGYLREGKVARVPQKYNLIWKEGLVCNYLVVISCFEFI
jgi:hypothetical protein